MSEAYDFIKAWTKEGEFSGWFNICIKPPTGIHIIVSIKNWGCAIARLSHDNKVFICSLPHVDSPTFLQIPVKEITHWAIIPTIKGEK